MAIGFLMVSLVRKESEGMGIYKIKSISHSGTKGTRGLPREDGRYPFKGWQNSKA